MDSIREENKVIEKKIIIVVCIVGNTFSNTFLRCWTELIGYGLTNNIQFILSNFSGDNIFTSKNKCLLENPNNGENQPLFQGKINYDYILMMSNKTIFSIDTFKKLFEQNKDVISCVSSNRVDMNKLNFIQSITFDKDSIYEFISRDGVNHLKEQNMDIIKIDFNQMNFTLIKKGVFEKIGYPWFSVEPSSGDLSGELYFFKKCKSLNIDTYISINNSVGIENNIVI